jgi:hypothetical protein
VRSVVSHIYVYMCVQTSFSSQDSDRSGIENARMDQIIETQQAILMKLMELSSQQHHYSASSPHPRSTPFQPENVEQWPESYRMPFNQPQLGICLPGSDWSLFDKLESRIPVDRGCSSDGTSLGPTFCQPLTQSMTNFCSGPFPTPQEGLSGSEGGVEDSTEVNYIIVN